ncbi:MAG: UPF0271 protein [Cyclobacteriaceae bacterium]|nr:MAG: UPF0271 protein [Cyclobacteriaceae bacterium]
MKSIDINCDMGETATGIDEQIMPLITSSNIACGYHAGGTRQMENTIKLAMMYKVQVGAHPGFPDKKGFGRNRMDLPVDKLEDIIRHQLNDLKDIAEHLGASVKYVKLHGALYHQASVEEHTASTFLNAVSATDASLKIVGLAGSLLERLSESRGFTFVPEAFADRKYESDGSLRSRTLPGAVITNPELACEQVMDIINDQQVSAYDGSKTAVNAKTICIHGDNPAALEILRSLDRTLRHHGVLKQSL